MVYPCAIPAALQVCMICLDTNSKLSLIRQPNLKEAYKNLIGNHRTNHISLKQKLCILCTQRLWNFSRLREQSLRARSLMMYLVEKYGKITRKHIKLINRQENKLKWDFVTSYLGPDHCDLYIEEYVVDNTHAPLEETNNEVKSEKDSSSDEEEMGENVPEGHDDLVLKTQVVPEVSCNDSIGSLEEPMCVVLTPTAGPSSALPEVDPIKCEDEDSAETCGVSSQRIQNNTNLANNTNNERERRETKPLSCHSMETRRSKPFKGCIPSKKRRMNIDSSLSSIPNGSEKTTQALADPPRKRRKYNTSLKERKLKKKKEKLDKYTLKTGCDDKCTKKCSSVFTADEREKINQNFWKMTHSEKRVFLRSHYIVAVPKRECNRERKRNPRRCFTLQKSNGTLVIVCKTFFLTTLGFDKHNDSMLSACLDINKDTDHRGKHSKTRKFDRKIIIEHIESFNPSAPRYHREHSPNRRYLPAELTVSFMYKDFCSKHPTVKISYEMYRTQFKSMNISFARLNNVAEE